ncbi:MAG: hypothetical protein OXB86_00375 [Bdellovibrionales bacterium]|nr:hypothetical protein [Bdellovibrionales bacterium]
MKSIIYLMKFWYLFLILISFSCSCLESRSPSSKLIFPDKKLEEIIVRGNYGPGGQKAAEALRQLFLEEELDLKKGETIDEAINNRYQHRLKEYFIHSGQRYCYHKTSNKALVSNRDLTARLYDNEGKMLEEDFLRPESPVEGRFSKGVIAYLPYHDEGHEIRIVRLEGVKEVVIESLQFESHSDLIRLTHPDTQRNVVSGEIVFDTKDNCHVTPGPY